MAFGSWVREHADALLAAAEPCLMNADGIRSEAAASAIERDASRSTRHSKGIRNYAVPAFMIGRALQWLGRDHFICSGK